MGLQQSRLCRFVPTSVKCAESTSAVRQPIPPAARGNLTSPFYEPLSDDHRGFAPKGQLIAYLQPKLAATSKSIGDKQFDPKMIFRYLLVRQLTKC